MENEPKVYKKMEQGLNQLCEFNENRDVQEVVSGLAVDITDALQTGVVHDSTYEEDSNGISEPERILGRISDNFDAIEAERAIRKYGKKAEPIVTKSTEPASAAQTASAGEPKSE